MTSVRIIALLALVMILLAPLIAFAQSTTPPCRFYGTVQLDGKPVSDGTVVTASIEGALYTTTTPAIYGNSTYAITIMPADGIGYSDGTLVTFKIGNYTAEQTGRWETAGDIERNLSAWMPPPPTPSPSPTPQHTPVPTPTPSPTPSPIPTFTPIPTATPTPSSPEVTTNNWTNIILIACICVIIICFVIVAYLVWKYLIRPRKGDTKRQKGA